MTDDTRALIRHLYFVAQVPLHAIAERLELSVPAVRRALVLPGGRATAPDPAPVAYALSPIDPAPHRQKLKVRFLPPVVFRVPRRDR